MAQPSLTNTFSVFITKIIRKTSSVQMNSFLFRLLACVCYKRERLSVLKKIFAMPVKMNMYLDLIKSDIIVRMLF